MTSCPPLQQKCKNAGDGDSISAKIKLPPVERKRGYGNRNLRKRNPFKLPSGIKWVDLCQRENLAALKLRRDERLGKSHEKHTHRTRHSGKTLPQIKKLFKQIDLEIEKQEQEEKEKLPYEEHALTIAQRLRVRAVEKETMYELIRRKREMFIVNFSLHTRKDEIAEYQLKARQEETKVNQNAEKLRREAVLFDEFLKATDRAAVEAMKNAEKETRLKHEKVVALRRKQDQLYKLKADLTKKDEQLAEYLFYKTFLLRFHHNRTSKKPGLTAERWSEHKKAVRKKKLAQKTKKHSIANVPMVIDPTKRKNSISMKKQTSALKKYQRNRSSSLKSSLINVDSSSKINHSSRYKVTLASLENENNSSLPPAPKPRLPFTKIEYPEEWDEDEGTESEPTKDKHETDIEIVSYILNDPKIILKVIHQKEEENLKLIYNFQNSQETLDDIKYLHKVKMRQKEKQLVRLKEQVKLMKENLSVAEEKCGNLHTMCLLLDFNSTGFGSNEEEELNSRVEKVYISVFGRLIVNIDSLTMLTCIEKRMELLMDELDSLPEKAVADFKKLKERERRLALREEKISMQKKRQEERAKRALERANANLSKKIGRKLLFRSQPIRARHSAERKSLKAEVQDDNQIYFQ